MIPSFPNAARIAAGGIRTFVVRCELMGGFSGFGGTLPSGQTIAVGPTGPQGPQGPPGASAALYSATASDPVSQYQVIAQVGGVPVVADSSNEQHAGSVTGMAMAGALSGAQFNVQFGGTISNSGWNWDTTKPVYLNGAGALSQNPPTTGFCQIIGTPVDSTTLLIQLQPPVVLAA